MKNLPNIEKLPGRTDYTGYGAGRVWRVMRARGKGWEAYVTRGDYCPRITADTLAHVSLNLTELDAAHARGTAKE